MRIGNYLSSSFPTENGLKQEDKVQEAKLGLDMNDSHQVLAYDDLNLIDEMIPEQ